MRASILAGLVVVALGACGEADGEGARLLARADADAPMPMDASVMPDTGPPVREQPVAICSAGSTQPCTCADGEAGTQTCLSTQWGQCRCGSAGVATGRCKAGYYVGEFSGEYWSGEFDFLGTGQSWVPLPVAAIDQGGNPGWAFTLEEQSTSLGAEFSIYRVGNGCLIGAAETPIFGTHPFFGVIRGELDCETGFFDGVLSGQYYVQGNPDNAYPFEGPLLGEFVPETESLERGTWDVVEHMTSDNPPGGAGTWSATWMGDVDSAPPLPPECEALLAEGD